MNPALFFPVFTAGRACGFCGSILAPTNYHNFESSLGIAKKEPEGGVESRLFNRGPKKTRGHAVVASVTGLQGLNSRAKRTRLINAMGITTSHSAHEVLVCTHSNCYRLAIFGFMASQTAKDQRCAFAFCDSYSYAFLLCVVVYYFIYNIAALNLLKRY